MRIPFLSALTLAALIAMGPVGPAAAQQKRPIDISAEGMSSRYTQQLALDVDDATGHQVRVQETHRTFAVDHQPMIDGERIVESWIRGFSNYTSGIGPAWGYATWITDQGNRIHAEYSGASESRLTDTGSRRGSYHGTLKLTGGTGRFAGVRGVLVDVTEFDTDPKNGYNRGTSHGEYWFEP